MVSVYEAFQLAINLGVFVLTFIGVIVAILTLVSKHK
ncbi:MAG TPA: putative holin-like toxin [Ureibacillus sp.]|nr:putative holin-like toxin [Ureibacillus sp.]